MSTADRFKEKQMKDAATKAQLDHVAAFNELVVMQPDVPLWPLVVQLQEAFAKPEYREYHPDVVVRITKDDDAVAVLWQSQVRDLPETFLSVQATKREVPRAAEIADPSVMDEFLFMIEDINQNDRDSAAAMLVRAVMLAFKEHLVVCLDGDPDKNHYLVQAYTKDRKHLLDIQVYYDVIQEDIAYRQQAQ